MKRILTPIILFSITLAVCDYLRAESPPEQSGGEQPVSAPQYNTELVLQQSILGYFDALAKKDKKQALSFIHPQSPGLSIVTSTMDTMFPIATFKYDITQPKLIGLDGEFAFMRYKHTANLLASTVQFDDGRQELDTLDVFKKQGQTWKRWTTTTLVSTPKPTGKRISPTIKPIVGQKIYIDPAAKVIFERAAKLYGSKAKWSGQITATGYVTKTISIAFERPKHLRIERREEGDFSLRVANGSRISKYSKSDGQAAETSQDPQLESIEELLNAYSVNEAVGLGAGGSIALFLHGKSGLDGAEFENAKEYATALIVKKLPDTTWKGQTCHRVVTDVRFKAEDEFDVTHHRNEQWFTSDGKLIKDIGFQKMKGGNGAKSDEWNDEITQQNFAPIFTPQTFIFTPPKTK